MGKIQTFPRYLETIMAWRCLSRAALRCGFFPRRAARPLPPKRLLHPPRGGASSRPSCASPQLHAVLRGLSFCCAALSLPLFHSAVLQANRACPRACGGGAGPLPPPSRVFARCASSSNHRSRAPRRRCTASCCSRCCWARHLYKKSKLTTCVHEKAAAVCAKPLSSSSCITTAAAA